MSATEQYKFSRRRNIAKDCPCGRSNKDGKFAPFEGFEDKGYCHSCSKSFFPEDTEPVERMEKAPEPVIKYIPNEVVNQMQCGYERNTFVRYLQTLFDEETVNRVVTSYRLGTSNDGHCIFWQIDREGKVRTGKGIHYGDDGHRVGIPIWAHNKLGIPNENTRKCLFGLHLVKIDSIVGVVEGEKTACIMSAMMPHLTWVSTGCKGNINQVFEIRHNKVIVFPDANAFGDWSKELEPYSFKISTALQNSLPAEQQTENIDLADVLPLPTEHDGAGCLVDPVKGYPTSWNILVEKHPAVNLLANQFDAVEISDPSAGWISADVFLSKPKAMPTLTLEDYRKNGWTSHSSPCQTYQKP